MSKFELQDCYEPKRTAKVDIDTDRSSCCGAEIVYFEAAYRRTPKGLFEVGQYNGCEECGAMTDPVPTERPELQPMSADEILKAMEDTYQACAHDVDGDWDPEDVIDFLVSTNGSHADRWSNDRFWATREFTPKRIDAAVEKFKARYGHTE